jgi:transcriptional regulator with XRE-family HTH domain
MWVDTRGLLGHPYRVASGKDSERLASFVLSERERAAWSQVDLAKRMHVDVKTVRRIEANHSVSKRTLAALDRVFEWQPGSARKVLTGGLPTPRAESAKADGPPWLVNGEPDLRDDIERGIWIITEVDEEVRWSHIQRHRKQST